VILKKIDPRFRGDDGIFFNLLTALEINFM
jgi:hypothetical protein